MRVSGQGSLRVELCRGKDDRLLARIDEDLGTAISKRSSSRRDTAHLRRLSWTKLQIFFLHMSNVDAPRLQRAQALRSLAPPDRVRMRPDRLILPSKKSTSIEAVRVQRPQVIVLDALPRYRVVIANRDLRQDVIGLDGRKDVFWRYSVARCLCGCAIAEGAEDVASMLAPCAWRFVEVACAA